jgi:hypothetical protein
MGLQKTPLQWLQSAVVIIVWMPSGRTRCTLILWIRPHVLLSAKAVGSAWLPVTSAWNVSVLPPHSLLSFYAICLDTDATESDTNVLSSWFYLCGVHPVALFTYTIWTYDIYDIYIYICNPQSLLFLFRLLPHWGNRRNNKKKELRLRITYTYISYILYYVHIVLVHDVYGLDAYMVTHPGGGGR